MVEAQDAGQISQQIIEERLAAEEISPIEKLAFMAEFLARTGYLGQHDRREDNSLELRVRSFQSRLSRYVRLLVLAGNGGPEFTKFYLSDLPRSLLDIAELGNLRYP